MSEREFTRLLDEKLRRLDGEERKRTLAYYKEIISDRMDEGLSEEEAVSGLESPDEIAERLLADAAERGALRPKPRPVSTALIILGSPLWLPLLIAVGAVMLAVYAVIWALIIALVAVVLAFAAAGLAGLVGFAVALTLNPALAAAMFGCALMLMGVALLLVFPVIAAAKALAKCTGRACVWLWNKTFGRFGRRT